MKYSIKIFILFLISTACASAGTWENYSNMTQITDAMPVGDHIWITAKGGVVDHNTTTGDNFYYKNGIAGLPSASVEQIALRKSDNSIFIGTYENGVAILNSGAWETYPFPVPMSLYRMKFDNYENLWIQSTAGLYKFDGISHTYTFINSVGGAGWDFNAWDFDITSDDKVLIFTGTNCLVIDAVSNIAIDSFPNTASPVVLSCSPATVRLYGIDEDTYLIANGGSWEFEFRDGSFASGTTGLPDFGFTGNIERGEDHILYTIVGGIDLYKLEGLSWTFVKTLSVEYNDQIIYADADNYYINESIFGYTPKLFTVQASSTDAIAINEFAFTSNNIQGIEEDADGNILMYSGGSLFNYNAAANNWDHFLNVPTTYDVFTGMKIANGNIYGVDYGDMITWYDGTTWNHVPKASGYSSTYVYDYDVTSAGVIYFSNDEGLFKYEGGTTVNIEETPGIYDWYLSMGFDESRNTLWLGTLEGIVKYDAGTDAFHPVSGIPGIGEGSSIQKVALDANNNVWFGANNSKVYMFDGTDWTDLSMPSDAGDFIIDFAFDGTKTYFTLIEGIGGVYMHDVADDSWKLYNSSEDVHIISNLMSGMLIDADKNIWFAHKDAGVSLLRSEETPDGLTDIISNNVFRVYPNPAKDVIYLDMHFSNPVDITIFDAAGNLVKETISTSSIVELENLNGGIYIINVADRISGENYHQKFMIQ